MKQVQIPENLFFDLCEYFLWHDRTDERDFIADNISTALQEKACKMLDRMAFTEYKTAPTPELREKARLEYLNRRSISKKFITEKEEREIMPTDEKI